MFNAPMTYGLSNAANRNIWQYNLTTAAPNDIFGAMNDASIWKYGAQVGSMVDSTAALQMSLVPMMEQFYAQMSQMWQQVMTNIQAGNANSSITIPGIDVNNGVNGNNTKISEGKIITLLQRMGSGQAVADRINQEIEINGNKTTILNRLLSLVTAYRNNPKDAELSTENYKKVWEIADRYHKSGDVSSEDFAILREIAINPTGAVDEVDGEDDDSDDTDETSITSVVEAKDEPAFKTAVNEAAESFSNALYGLGTDYAQLRTALDGCTPENIIEVYDKFYKDYGINEGETLIDAIYDDFDDWTNKWYGITGSASTYHNVHDKLIERAENHIKNYGDNEAKDLATAIATFKASFEGINDDNYDSKKEEISKMFTDMIEAIRKAEKAQIAKEQND